MRWVLVAMFAVLAMGRPATAAADLDPDARYETLLTAAKSGAAAVNWQALRFAYADRSSFNVFDDGTLAARKAMTEAFKGGDFAKVLDLAKQIIDKDYVDAEGHLVASMAYTRLGETDAAANERRIALGLLGSIETGDGSSAKTAFTVVSVSEEYSLMRARSLRVTRQSLVNRDGHVFDVLDTVDPNGASASYYFLIDRVMAAERKQTGLKP